MSARMFWSRFAQDEPWREQIRRRMAWQEWVVRCGEPNCASHARMQPAIFARVNGLMYNNRWYHALNCTKGTLTNQCEEILRTFKEMIPKRHRLPLGLLLVNRGAITSQQLRNALERQRLTGKHKLGYWLREAGNLRETHVASALGQQWGVAVFPMGERTIRNLEEMGLPFPVFATSKAVPVHQNGKGGAVHIAFSERVDHTLLYAVEEMLGCRTIACMGAESEVNQALEEWQRRCVESEICFDTVREAWEIAETVCSYAAQLNAKQIKLARAGAFLWAAYFGNGARRNVLFRAPTAGRVEHKRANVERIKDFREVGDIRSDSVRESAEPI